jgi:hypothetical protein
MDKAKFIKAINKKIFYKISVEDLDFVLDPNNSIADHPKLSLPEATELYDFWEIYCAGWNHGQS